MLSREYVPRWKIEMEQVTKEVTKEVTYTVTYTEAIAAIQFMKDEGIAEESIRKYAKQKNVSMEVLDNILNSGEAKEAAHV